MNVDWMKEHSGWIVAIIAVGISAAQFIVDRKTQLSIAEQAKKEHKITVDNDAEQNEDRANDYLAEVLALIRKDARNADITAQENVDSLLGSTGNFSRPYNGSFLTKYKQSKKDFNTEREVLLKDLNSKEEIIKKRYKGEEFESNIEMFQGRIGEQFDKRIQEAMRTVISEIPSSDSTVAMRTSHYKSLLKYAARFEPDSNWTAGTASSGRNMRSSPTSADSTNILPKGANEGVSMSILELDASGSWYYVRLKGGHEGWIHKNGVLLDPRNVLY